MPKFFMILIIMLMSASSAFAFKCYMTLVKGACWKDYEVNLFVYDLKDITKQILKVTAPKGKNWGRAVFECQPKQSMKLQANYFPIFWQSGKGKVYDSLSYWSLPDKVQGNEVAWNINICFPKQFAEVPLPPKASGDCQCDLTSIPDVPK